MDNAKEIMIEPTGNGDEISTLVETASKEGIKKFLFYPDSKEFKNNDLISISSSDESDVKLVSISYLSHCPSSHSCKAWVFKDSLSS